MLRHQYVGHHPGEYASEHRAPSGSADSKTKPSDCRRSSSDPSLVDASRGSADLVSIARLATPMVSDDSDDDMRDEDHMASPPESYRTLFGKAAVLPAKQRPLQHRVDSVELNLSRMAKEKPARASIIFESTKWAA